MNTSTSQYIHSRENPFLKELRHLVQDNTRYRKQGRVWVEGDHLYRAALDRGYRPVAGVFSETYWTSAQAELCHVASKNIIIPERFFRELSALDSPADVGFIFELPQPQAIQAQAASVILDRVQDAGNVGSILRSASAFGFRQIIALKGTAALWSPKVLRAGMGAHWGVRLFEGMELADLTSLTLPMVLTSSHSGEYLHQLWREKALPKPCAWIFGHEGQGVRQELQDLASVQVRIAQPGGEESLNVGAAAAICLHASALV